MKRFTETAKWDDRWYRNLSPSAKLLRDFIVDKCDAVGIWEPDLESASFFIGAKIEQKHLDEIADRLQLLPSGKYLVRRFIWFQYGELSEKCPPHKTVLRLIQQNGLERQGLDYVHANGTALAPASAPPKEPPKPKVEEKPKELPAHLNTARIQNRWQVWQNHRRGLKKPGMGWIALFNEQIEFLSTLDESVAFETLDTAIRNGWQGLYERKPNATNQSTGNSGINPRNVGCVPNTTDYEKVVAARAVGGKVAQT